MRRTNLLLIAFVTLAIGVGALSACTKKTGDTNTATTNVNGTIVNAPANPGLILGIAPAKGPSVGGTSVTITGEGFTGNPKVLFGTAQGTAVQVKSDKEITVTTPAGAKGVVDVTLQNDTGPTSSLQDGFRYE